MKKLILIILILCSLGAGAQITEQFIGVPTTLLKHRGYFQAGTTFTPPTDTILPVNIPLGVTRKLLAIKGDTLYIYTTGLGKWTAVGTRNFANANLTLTGNRLHEAAGFDLEIDNAGLFHVTSENTTLEASEDILITAVQSLSVSANDISVATLDEEGIKYSSNINGSLVDLSLVTKKYVDSLHAAGGGGDEILFGTPGVATFDSLTYFPSWSASHIMIKEIKVTGTGAATVTKTVTDSTIHYEIDVDLSTGVQTSSATSLTLASIGTYVFNGASNTTWTLPAIAGNDGRKYYIKNRGTANITLQRAGSDQLFFASAVNSIVILPGDAYIIQNDGSYWLVM